MCIYLLLIYLYNVWLASGSSHIVTILNLYKVYFVLMVIILDFSRILMQSIFELGIYKVYLICLDILFICVQFIK